jgi:hypothetical protein
MSNRVVIASIRNIVDIYLSTGEYYYVGGDVVGSEDNFWRGVLSISDLIEGHVGGTIKALEITL